MQDMLQSRKTEFKGNDSEQRLKSLEAELRKDIEENFRNRIKAIHVQREQNHARNEEKGKLVFKQTSKHIGDMVTENMRANIAEKTRARAELIKQREEMKEMLIEMNSEFEKRQKIVNAKRVEVEKILKERDVERDFNSKKLKKLRQSVKRLWMENDMSARVCLRFLKSIYAEIMNSMSSSSHRDSHGQVVSRCKTEIRRLLAIKRLTQKIEARELLKAKVEKKKQMGLASGLSTAELDAIASDLWRFTQILQDRDRALVVEIKDYETRFGSAFMHMGEPFLHKFLDEINHHDESVEEIERNAPHLDARLSHRKLFHSKSKEEIDHEYLEAHKRMKARAQMHERQHRPAGDVGYDHKDITILHNTMERLHYDDEDV